MSVTVAKTAGFCNGVNRAVSIVQKEINEGKKVATIGHIIHNPQVVKEFERKGVIVVDDVSQIPDGYTAVIRAHGVPQSVYSELEMRHIPYMDATCSAVAKTHRIISKASMEKKTILYAGDKNHPETIGAIGHGNMSKVNVFADVQELTQLITQTDISNDKDFILLAQTTFNPNEWNRCLQIIDKYLPDTEIINTICYATSERQKEAAYLAVNSGCMVIIGGKHSSNTAELAETCNKYCRTILVEKPSELHMYQFKKNEKISITAGASTPLTIVEEAEAILNKALQAIKEDPIKSISKEDYNNNVPYIDSKDIQDDSNGAIQRNNSLNHETIGTYKPFTGGINIAVGKIIVNVDEASEIGLLEKVLKVLVKVA